MEKKETIRIFFGVYCNIKKAYPYDILHRHDEIEMTFFLTDEPVIIRFGGTVLKIRPNETVLFWGAIPHQLVRISPRNKQYWLTIPPSIFLRWELPQPLSTHLLNGKILIEQNESMRKIDIAYFPLWKRDAASGEKPILSNLLLSFEIRFRRFRDFSIQPKSDKEKRHEKIKGDNESFLKMYDYITRNFKSHLTTSSIARHIGLNPNYVSTLFRSACGIRITEFIQMLRIYEAQRLLLSTQLDVEQIVTTAGFGSRAMLYASFHHFCGTSPKQYRNNLRWEELVETPKDKKCERLLRESMYDQLRF
ncbi:MAG: helix-turn-helix domain-containing protein [Spirochaetales bacterium]|nr:helix-turn-helix domain-containing protein [Spirochaetales bacterium]